MMRLSSVLLLSLQLLLLLSAPLDGLQFEPFNPEEILHFKGLRSGEEDEIVLRTFPILLPDITHPYNPSILPRENGYMLAFRYDPPWDGSGTRVVRVGMMPLDTDLVPLHTQSTLLDTGNPSSEDQGYDRQIQSASPPHRLDRCRGARPRKSQASWRLCSALPIYAPQQGGSH